MKNLKTTLVIAAASLLLAFGLSACEDIFGVAPILKYDGGSYTFTVPASEAGTQSLTESINTADVLAFIDKAGYSLDKFKRVSVESAAFEIASGDVTFDVVDNASASFSADGSDLKQIASVTPEKKALTKVSLTVDKNVNLIDLFKNETLTAVSSVTTNTAITQEVQMKVSYTLAIQPNL